MAIETIKVPDIGGAEGVDVIELCVAVGDSVAAEDSIIVVETDKASMDIPTPVAGKIVALKVAEGDKVSEGDLMVEIEVEGAAAAESAPAAETAAPAPAPAAPAGASSEQAFSVPDLGGSEGVEVIEICVEPGDEIAEGDSVVVLETDKASMEIPAEAAGTVVSIAVKEGDKVSPGDALVVLTVAGAAPSAAPASAPVAAAPAPVAASAEEPLLVPDLGGSENVEIIEVCVAAGDDVADGDSIIVLETDKASMEIPAPKSGKIVSLSVKEGDKVSAGDAMGVILAEGAAPAAAQAPAASAPAPASAKAAPAPAKQSAPAAAEVTGNDNVYAGPAVRKLARQLGATLANVKGSGPRGRLNKDDVRAYVKQIVQQVEKGGSAATGGSGIPAIPEVDFSKFGDIELKKLSKIQKITANNMVRNWLNVPHVTQWDDADISDLEAFRKGLKAEAEKRGSKMTPLPFLLKACAAALRAEPSFNVSLHADGEHVVQKDYVHIGIAVDSPVGLVVPVIKDVDKKSLWELADEFTAIVGKARAGKLMPKDMQGGCFTISSLGAMGGNGFTPIVNAPEVAILGVSKAQMKPVWNGKDFEPRNMLPLSLSYDHRAVNGADAGRFFTYLTSVLADVRRLLL